MKYLFLLLLLGFCCKLCLDINIITENVSFVTLKASNRIPQTVNYEYTSYSLSNCLSDLYDLKCSLADLEEKKRICTVEQCELQKKAELKKKVVSLIRQDIDKYCPDKKKKKKKKEYLDPQICIELKNSLHDALKNEKNAEHQAASKERECLNFEKKICLKRNEVISKEEACAAIESRLSIPGLPAPLRVVDGGPLDMPTHKFSEQDKIALQELISHLSASLTVCLEELSLLLLRLGELQTKSELSRKHLEKAVHRGVKSKLTEFVSKAKGLTSGTKPSRNRNRSIKLQMVHVATLESEVYAKDRMCRNLEKDLQKAKEKLEEVESTCRRQGCCGCLCGCLRRVSKTLRRCFKRN